MATPKPDKKLKVDVLDNPKGQNGNAIALLQVFRKQAKREGWTKDEIQEVTDEAKDGDYDHLIRTLQSYIE